MAQRVGVASRKPVALGPRENEIGRGPLRLGGHEIRKRSVLQPAAAASPGRRAPPLAGIAGIPAPVSQGQTALRQIRMMVLEQTLHNAIVGEPYEAKLEMSGGAAPVLWEPLTPLPPGMGLEPDAEFRHAFLCGHDGGPPLHVRPWRSGPGAGPVRSARHARHDLRRTSKETGGGARSTGRR